MNVNETFPTTTRGLRGKRTTGLRKARTSDYLINSRVSASSRRFRIFFKHVEFFLEIGSPAETICLDIFGGHL